MSSAATLKNIVDLFLAVSKAHSQVKAVGTGEPVDESPAGNQSYPSVWLETPYNFTQSTRSVLNFHFMFTVLDLPSNDDADKFTIVNKTHLIAVSILIRFKAELEARIGGAILEDGWEGISWEDAKDDNLTGWRLEFNLKVTIPVSECNGPFNPIP